MRDNAHLSDAPLSPALRAAIDEMQAEPVVPAPWRARVLGDVRRAHASRVGRRRALAIGLAAALCLLIAGGALRRGGSRAASDAVSDAESVRFSVIAPAARHVALVGDFDRWSPRGVPMQRAADGRTWTVNVALPPGRHAFAYMIDGALRSDPTAAQAVEDDFGAPSSVIVVSGRGSE